MTNDELTHFTELRDVRTSRLGPLTPYQVRVHTWIEACFGSSIAYDRRERTHRFLEEAIELAQATGCTAAEAHQLVDYVFGRPVGDPPQEVGGVMVTLAGVCVANGLDMDAEAERELTRVWGKMAEIRAKHASKPSGTALPGGYPPSFGGMPIHIDTSLPPDVFRIVPLGQSAADGPPNFAATEPAGAA